MEMFTKDGLVWWIGVVENRNDPIKLGRCKVRIFGYHIGDKSILPTEDLPWAVAMQPITSAAISGKGGTPVGPIEGTWVVGWFLDGNEKQQPMMIGTLGGQPPGNPLCEIKNLKTNTINGNFWKDSSNNPVYDSFGNPIARDTDTTSDNVVVENLPPLSLDNIKTLISAIGQRESSNSYTAVNSFGYLGKFQFGAAALIDLGYVYAGATNNNLSDPSWWVNPPKDGIKTKEDFLANGNVQEQAMFNFLKINYKRLLNNKVISINDDAATVGGYLASAHLVGAGNANKLDKKDGNSVKAGTYFSIGSTACGGDGTIPKDASDIANRDSYVPGNPNNLTNDPTKSLNSPELARTQSFADPNKVYPTCEYSGTVDTNKLAIGDDTHSSLSKKKLNRIENIPLAGTYNTWNEPISAFCARYPYNQVIETESGHIVELDNTPGKERIHVYHKTGTFIEIDVNGSMVRKVIGDNYEILDRNNNVYVKGAHNLTIDGATKILVRDNADIQIEGNSNIVSNGNMNISAAKNAAVFSKNTIVTGTESVGIISDGDVNIQGRNVFIKATGNMNLDAGASFSALGRISAALHGAITKIKMGAEKVSQLGVSFKPPAARTPDNTSLAYLTLPTCTPQAFLYDANDPEAQEFREKKIANGELIDSVPRASANVDATVNGLFGKECDCNEFANFLDFPDTIRLSKYFTLGSLTNRAPASSTALQSNRGLSKADIACNLKNLAVSCLDPIKSKYSDMIVTSGFRTGGSTSDHDIGCAADMQFTKHNLDEYFEIVQWIRTNVPFKQLLLEYQQRSNGKIAWIHIAYSKNNAVASLPTATFFNHSVYARNQFVNLA